MSYKIGKKISIRNKIIKYLDSIRAFLGNYTREMILKLYRLNLVCLLFDRIQYKDCILIMLKIELWIFWYVLYFKNYLKLAFAIFTKIISVHVYRIMMIFIYTCWYVHDDIYLNL